jgi:hypothetical protein
MVQGSWAINAQRFLSIPGVNYRKSITRQDILNDAPNDRFIIHHQNSCNALNVRGHLCIQNPLSGAVFTALWV